MEPDVLLLSSQQSHPVLSKLSQSKNPYLVFSINILISGGPGSSVGIATDYGLSGIESRWGQDFPPVQTGPGTHPASCTIGTGSFQGLKCSRGMGLTTHPLLVPW